MASPDRFQRAIAAIDAANADDPHEIELRGRRRPKELAHAELATEWVRRLDPDASEALLLAARAHHVRRWEIPRDRYPRNRPGYLRWRKALQELHASTAARILADAGYDQDTGRRVQEIIRKRGLGRDREVQIFEDALCLAFLETQLAAFAADQPAGTATSVLAKTLAKMSPAGLQAARDLDLPGPTRGLLAAALDSIES